MRVRLTKVTIGAEFVIDHGDGHELEPGVFSPPPMTASEWKDFDLLTAITREVNNSD